MWVSALRASAGRSRQRGCQGHVAARDALGAVVERKLRWALVSPTTICRRQRVGVCLVIRVQRCGRLSDESAQCCRCLLAPRGAAPQAVELAGDASGSTPAAALRAAGALRPEAPQRINARLAVRHGLRVHPRGSGPRAEIDGGTGAGTAVLALGVVSATACCRRHQDHHDHEQAARREHRVRRVGVLRHATRIGHEPTDTTPGGTTQTAGSAVR